MPGLSPTGFSHRDTGAGCVALPARHCAWLAAALTCVACQTRPAAPPDEGIPIESLGTLGASAPTRKGPPPRPEAERLLEQELVRDMASQLELGERSVEEGLNLAGTADWLVSTLEGYGHSVARLGFEAPDGPVQNLRVEVPGLMRGNEVVVVATHFDSPRGSPGANSAATGTAALLYLARHFLGKRPQRTLHLVWLTHHHLAGRDDATGSRTYVEQWDPRGRELVAMLELESLGCYRSGKHTQLWPTGLGRDAGDFLQLRVLVEDSDAESALRGSLLMDSRLPLEVVSPQSASQWNEHPDARPFAEAGIASFVLSDTGARRCPEHGTSKDDPSIIDGERFSHVVSLLPDAVLALTGPLGTPPR